MIEPSLRDLLEAIVVAGVAITSRALADAVPELEVTLSQWRLLLVLGEREEGATLTELGQRVGVTLPATSRQVRRLAGKGLLEVRRDERDRRAARIRLSDAGCRVRDRILEYRRAELARIAASIDVTPQGLTELASVAAACRAYR